MLIRMAPLLTRMARMLTRMTGWLAGSNIIHTHVLAFREKRRHVAYCIPFVFFSPKYPKCIHGKGSFMSNTMFLVSASQNNTILA